MNNDELELDKQAMVEVKDEELRAKIISDLGLDEVDHAEVIEKAFQREKAQRALTSKAIQAKIENRTRKEELEKELNVLKTAPPKAQFNEEEFLKKTEEKVRSEFEDRDLRALDLPDALKEDIKLYSKNLGKSVLETAADPYFKAKAEEYQAQKKVEEAALSNNNNTPPKYTKATLTTEGMEKIDVSTPEGQKKFVEEWDKRKKSAE